MNTLQVRCSETQGSESPSPADFAMIYCQLLNRMDHCNYVSLLIFTVTTRMCQLRKVCRKYIWCSAMLVENGFRKQTQEGSNKTHLPGERRWLHGNWGRRRAGCLARKESLPPQSVPPPGPAGVEEGQPPHLWLLRQPPTGELLTAPRQSLLRPRPTRHLWPGSVLRAPSGHPWQRVAVETRHTSQV